MIQLNELFNSVINRRSPAQDDMRSTQTVLAIFGLIQVTWLCLYAVYGATALSDSFVGYLSALLGVLAILGVVALASFCVGGVFGFLFGIPKSSSGQGRTGENTAKDELEGRRWFRSNTNLEEMSDWLTKIIVGMGLVQIKELVAQFSVIASAIATELGPLPSASVMAGGTILGSLVLGFFAIYLMTRLYLAAAFSRAEEGLIQLAQQSLIKLDLTSLSELERSWLRKALDAYSANQPLKLPDDFQRGSTDHMALRGLWYRSLIIPKEGPYWQPGKTVALTPVAEELVPNLQDALKINDPV